MSRVSDELVSVTTPTCWSALLRAAGLAVMLVFVSSAPADAALLTCISQSGAACVGSYEASEGTQSNTWKFYADSSICTPTTSDSCLLYTLEIAGTPTAGFSLDVRDLVTNQAALAAGALALFPTAVCIPTYDESSCGLFRVSELYGPAAFSDGYRLVITWFSNLNPLSQPPDDGLNTILQARGASTSFTNQLGLIDYDPAPTPTDPVISGRGDEFSTFGAFRFGSAQPIPEPASLLLVGAGLLGAWRRARRR